LEVGLDLAEVLLGISTRVLHDEDADLGIIQDKLDREPLHHRRLVVIAGEDEELSLTRSTLDELTHLSVEARRQSIVPEHGFQKEVQVRSTELAESIQVPLVECNPSYLLLECC